MFSPRTLRFLAALMFVSFVLALRPTSEVTAAPARTERGLDLWIHAPREAVARDLFVLDVQALGFPTATSTTTIPDATVEAAWDPESLVDGTRAQKPAVAPPSVRGTTDTLGRATLSLPVPDGRSRDLKLLVSVRVGDKERVRELTVSRVAAEVVELYVTDTRVVPGSSMSAWVLFSTRDRSQPIAGTPVDFELSQGGIARFSRRVVTDGSGSAVVRVPIPRDPDPEIWWQLTATVARPAFAVDAGAAPSASVRLTARDEIPGKPTLTARFDEGSVTAGGVAHYRLRLSDASGEAVTGHPVFVWAGPRGTAAPTDEEEFRKVAKKFLTDGAGYVLGEVPAPTTVPLLGTELSVAARLDFDGQKFAATRSIDVGRPRGTVDLVAEAGELVPGLEQRLYLTVLDDDAKPVAGTFALKGDGLSVDVATNAFGEGAFTWKVPAGIGARRETGPCPGAIAAAVNVKAKTGAAGAKAFNGVLAGGDGLPVCVSIDRAAKIIVRPKKSVVRSGESLDLEIVGAGSRALSIMLDREDGARTDLAWAQGESATIKIPDTASGLLTLSVASPKGDKQTTVAGAAVLVIPRVLPKIEGKVIGGRAVPKGTVQVEARLTDEAGGPLVGSVAAVVIDKFGGGSFGGLEKMDTRDGLCTSLGVDDERCEAVLSSADDAEILRRSQLRRVAGAPVGPVLDPTAGIEESMNETFRTVVRSLEGAVYQASASVETLPDVRRAVGGKSRFNPELMTLVTEAMSGAPETPGGEPLALADIIAMDPQITYDNVARRVTRLKLFQILVPIRTFRLQELPDPDEPALADPNAILRKLLRDGALTEAQLIDPWGGRFAFYKGGGSTVPFVTVQRGWDLRSPGPDGKLGTGDDVRSPFERVLESGTPYAEAVHEDELVDAPVDLRVAESTVAAWQDTLDRATGTALGDGAGGLGLSGMGSGGGGSGFGSGSGRLGGARMTKSVTEGIAFASPPMRTDAQGRVVLDIPLGDIETTWSIALVAIPDAARPAMSKLDVPVTVPLSAKVNAGVTWTNGDAGDAVVQVRNRTAADLDVTIELSAEGSIALDDVAAKKVVRVAKQGASVVRVKLRATSAGTGKLALKTSASGAPDDLLVHEIEVRHKGELLRLARATYVTEGFDFAPYLTRDKLAPIGLATLVLERGERRAIEAALAALAPEKLSSLEALADAVDAAGIVRAYGIAADGDDSPLAKRATDTGQAAAAKLFALMKSDHPLSFSLHGRAQRSGLLASMGARKNAAECPSDGDERSLPLDTVVAALDAEPVADGGAVKDCWAKFVAGAVNRARAEGDPAHVARALLGLARKAHRAGETRDLAASLMASVRPSGEGNVVLPGSSRADRALVYAALLVASDTAKDPAWRVSLTQWLLVQRDAEGSFGSASATRAAVQALIREAAAQTRTPQPETVRVDFGRAGTQDVVLAPGERKSITVPPTASAVIVVPEGNAVLARLERTFLRPYDVAPASVPSALALSVAWPTGMRAGHIGNLTVKVEGGGYHRQLGAVEVRIPLPPGVMLAAVVPGTRQIQGFLHVALDASSDDASVLVPVRFQLAGSFTAPEPTARFRDQEAAHSYDRARPIQVAP